MFTAFARAQQKCVLCELYAKLKMVLCRHCVCVCSSFRVFSLICRRCVCVQRTELRSGAHRSSEFLKSPVTPHTDHLSCTIRHGPWLCPHAVRGQTAHVHNFQFTYLCAMLLLPMSMLSFVKQPEATTTHEEKKSRPVALDTFCGRLWQNASVSDTHTRYGDSSRTSDGCVVAAAITNCSQSSVFFHPNGWAYGSAPA